MQRKHKGKKGQLMQNTEDQTQGLKNEYLTINMKNGEFKQE